MPDQAQPSLVNRAVVHEDVGSEATNAVVHGEVTPDTIASLSTLVDAVVLHDGIVCAGDEIVGATSADSVQQRFGSDSIWFALSEAGVVDEPATRVYEQLIIEDVSAQLEPNSEDASPAQDRSDWQKAWNNRARLKGRLTDILPYPAEQDWSYSQALSRLEDEDDSEIQELLDSMEPERRLDVIADALGFSYYGSPTAAAGAISGKAAEAAPVELYKHLASLHKVRVERLMGRHGFRHSYVPPLLSLVLDRCATAMDVPYAMVEVRSEFSEFRSAISRLSEELMAHPRLGDQLEITEQLDEAMNVLSEKVSRKQQRLVHRAFDIVKPGSVSGIVAGIGTKLVKADEDHRVLARWRAYVNIWDRAMDVRHYQTLVKRVFGRDISLVESAIHRAAKTTPMPTVR